MNKFTCSPKLFLVIFISIYLCACQPNSKKEELVPPADSASVTPGPTAEFKAKDSPEISSLLDEKLDTLYIEKDKIKSLIGRRLVLRAYINGQGKLTMFGYQTKDDNNDNSFEPANNHKKIELHSGNASTVAIGRSTFLPGAILLRDDFLTLIREINKPVNASMKFVVFCPAKDPSFSDQFIYNIVLTDYEPSAHALSIESIKSLTRVIVSANPSPPRNS
ncbi:MAG: hypothetical protein ABI683_01955 [Ginsengibacter sp.]